MEKFFDRLILVFLLAAAAAFFCEKVAIGAGFLVLCVASGWLADFVKWRRK